MSNWQRDHTNTHTLAESIQASEQLAERPHTHTHTGKERGRESEPVITMATNGGNLGSNVDFSPGVRVGLHWEGPPGEKRKIEVWIQQHPQTYIQLDKNGPE